MGIQVVKCGGEFFVDTLTLHRSAFCVIDEVSKLYRRKAHTVDNLVIPEVVGELPRRMKATAADHTLNMVVVGDVLYDETTPSSPWDGFEQNMDWLEANIWGIPASADGTRAGKVITPSTSVRVNPVQVYDFQQGDTMEGFDMFGHHTVGCLATLYVRIPAGKLV